jgi:Integrase core domain
MVFTTRLSGGKGGRNGFEHELRALGVVQKNSRPGHPGTCGKVERFQQTFKNWLEAQPDQPATVAELQILLDRFRALYNHHRPHSALPHRATPATAYTTRPKAGPGDRSTDSHTRVRTDRVDTGGKVTLRHAGKLYSIGLGRAHARTRVLILVEDLNIRIIDAATGELLRDLALDTTKRYQGTGRPPGPPPKT